MSAAAAENARVVALVWSDNRADMLAATVASLRLQSRPPDEIVVIDNASTDGSRALAETLQAGDGAPLRCLPLAAPLSRLAGERLAASALAADFFVLAGAGSRSSPLRIEEALSLLLTTPDLGCVCSCVAVEDSLGRALDTPQTQRANDGDVILRRRLYREGDILDVDSCTLRAHFLRTATPPLPADLATFAAAGADGYLPLWLAIADDSELLRVNDVWVKRLHADAAPGTTAPSIGEALAPLAAIVAALRRLPLERLYFFREAAGSPARVHETAVAEAQLALQLVELDRRFVGKPALGCREALVRAEQAVALSPDCLEAQAALAYARRVAPLPFAADDPSQPLAAWQAAAADIPPPPPSATGEAATRFRQWRAKAALHEIDGVYFGEHIVRHWPARPAFIVVETAPGRTPLADRLAAQIYPPAAGHTAAPGETLAAIAGAAAAMDAAWLLLLPPDTQAAPEALVRLGDAIACHGEARLIYADDEIAAADSTASDTPAMPRFKPDFDPLLLAGTDYLGAVAVHLPTALALAGELAPAGGCPAGNGAAAHDAAATGDSAREIARRLCAQGGRTAIAHVDELLFSLSGPLAAPAPPPQSEAAGGGSVTLLVVAAAALATTADDLRFWADWSRTAGCEALPCIAVDGAGLAHEINAAARRATGDALLLVGAASRPLGDGWPAAALALLAAGYGAVGLAGLAAGDDATDGSHYWGCGGIAGIGGGFDMLHGDCARPGDAGHLGRTACAHEASCLAADGLLTAKATFLAAGGFDADWQLPDAMAVDYCLRLGACGHHHAWTPQAALRRASAAWPGFDGDAGALLALRDRFIDRWRDRLAHDPYWNRHLSLRSPQAEVEHDLVGRWRPAFHDRLRVLALPMPASGQAAYRVSEPLRALDAAGLAQCSFACEPVLGRERAPTPIELARLAPDVLYLQAAFDDVRFAGLLAAARFNPDIFRVFSLDDRVSDMPAYNASSKSLPRDLVMQRMREALARCHRLVVSTEPLAELYRAQIDDIVVVPNRLEKARWLNLPQPRPADGAARNRPRVGWAGALQHAGDLAIIVEVVRALADEVDWVFFGMIPAGCETHVREFHPAVHLDAYPARLASLALDLALAPLAVNLFNEAKSNLRLIEYGIMGWPVVCTDIFPFRSNAAPVCRVPNDAARWIAAIREHLADRAALRQRGEELRRWVERHYLLEDHLDEWLAALTPTGKPPGA